MRAFTTWDRWWKIITISWCLLLYLDTSASSVRSSCYDNTCLFHWLEHAIVSPSIDIITAVLALVSWATSGYDNAFSKADFPGIAYNDRTWCIPGYPELHISDDVSEDPWSRDILGGYRIMHNLSVSHIPSAAFAVVWQSPFITEPWQSFYACMHKIRGSSWKSNMHSHKLSSQPHSTYAMRWYHCSRTSTSWLLYKTCSLSLTLSSGLLQSLYSTS